MLHLSGLLAGLSTLALLAVNGMALLALILRAWRKHDAGRLSKLLGRTLAVAWLVCIAALASDLAVLMQSHVPEARPSDKATILAAGIAEALNCLALSVFLTLLPLGTYIYLRVVARRTTPENAPAIPHLAVERIQPPSKRGTEVEWKIGSNERAAIEAHRAEMLAMVEKEVEEYVNTPSLCCDLEGFFPRRSALTGTYYIARESYLHPEADYDPQPDPWIQICVMTKFLGRPQSGRETEPQNYLGLAVWLRWPPRTRTFVIFRNTDSSAV